MKLNKQDYVLIISRRVGVKGGWGSQNSKTLVAEGMVETRLIPSWHLLSQSLQHQNNV